ncbi:hypothetical protein [Streptomyces sp. SP17KL33]|uniref:hypothetical protein n=1 Tax=Streptomyces sp. SP17KL33 TaxID=3002534 RepID=UPI002E77307D|nr:hypothetical protein [Streptomyces sp. SP17KL33]MEE1838094.1 hypothetical protein [Streptomyces sp. SP17KL33]
MARNIEVPVDDEAYAALEAEAARAGMTVPEFAGKTLLNDVNRRRFLGAARQFVDAWGPTFDEEFGRTRPNGAAA